MKTAQLIHLQRIALEHNANSPVKIPEFDQALEEWESDQNGMIGFLSCDFLFYRLL